MQNKIAFLVGFLAALASIEVQGERLVWQDEFDFLNLTTWFHEVTGWDGGNGELQYYRNNRKNSFVKDGVLFLRPTKTIEEIPDLERGKIVEPGCVKEPCVIEGGYDIIPPYFSPRMLSKYSVSVRYGRIEVRAKMPTGDWIGCAIWMYPVNETYGGWPKSGEIDIAEIRGNPDYRDFNGLNRGNTEVGSTLHFGPAWNYKGQIGNSTHAAPNKTWSDDFHIYEFTWTKDLVKFEVDSKVIYETAIPEGGFTELGNLYTDIYDGLSKDAPFDQDFYFILSLGIAGAAYPRGWKSGGRDRPWKGGDNRRQLWKSRHDWEHTWGPPEQHSMQVDYIRVYQLD